MIRKIRLFIVAAVVLVAGVGFLYTFLFGEGELHVLSIGDAGVEVTLDGKPLLRKSGGGDHFAFSVPQGQHSAVVTDKGTGKSLTYAIDVKNGLTKLLLPVRAEQCFVRFDMTTAAYVDKGSSSAKDSAPALKDRYLNTNAPIVVPSSTYFTMEEMPGKRRKRETINLIRDLPCSFMDKGEELLLAALSDESDDLYTLAGGAEDLKLELPDAEVADDAEAAPEPEANDTP